MSAGERVVYALPCYIQLRGKKISLNLNWYRNAHFQTLNQTKQAYRPISGKPFRADHIAVQYKLFLASKRRTDLMNWVSIADKYFMDFLVVSGYIPDDCFTHCAEVSASAELASGISENYILATVTILE